MSERLRVKSSLSVAGVHGETEPWVSSEDRHKQEGMCASGWVRLPASLVLMGVPVILGVGADVVASPVILGVSEHLGVQLPLGVL